MLQTSNHSVTNGAGPTTALGLDDAALNAWLKARKTAKEVVGYLHAGPYCKVYLPSDPSRTLIPADPDTKSRSTLRTLANQGRLHALEVDDAELLQATTAPTSWVAEAVDDDGIARLVNDRLVLLGRMAGRGDAITEPTGFRVWADAGCRCMFEGCAADLSHVPLYQKTARIGYLAHIVASDPRGPRGNVHESHALSDRPENIMLMCDAHHRLIDSFAPQDYDAARLRVMRAEHTAKVRRYLEALKLPSARALTIFAELGGVPTHFAETEYLEAILEAGCSMLPDVHHHIRRTQRDDRTSPDFWGNYLKDHELHISSLVNACAASNGFGADELAVFPIHHTPTLVLAGRILGEARPIRVFQYDRGRSTWKWDVPASAMAAGTVSVDSLPDRKVAEVLLSIELTANIEEDVLPQTIRAQVGNGTMPWIRIRIPSPDGRCIRRPEDLAQFVNVARRVVNHIQDVMRAKTVNVIAVAPASVVFSFGQLLQAGHHAVFRLYDRASSAKSFVEAFSIDGHSVVPPAGSQQAPIKIR